MEIPLIKITKNNQIFLIPIYPINIEYLKKIPDGTKLSCKIYEIMHITQRSYEQLHLYWAACKFIAENNDDKYFDTKEKVDEQIKIKCRHIDYWIYYTNEKTGEETLNIKTKSISFSNLKHLDACEYFNKAFEFMAEIMNMEINNFINAVKESMESNL